VNEEREYEKFETTGSWFWLSGNQMFRLPKTHNISGGSYSKPPVGLTPRGIVTWRVAKSEGTPDVLEVCYGKYPDTSEKWVRFILVNNTKESK